MKDIGVQLANEKSKGLVELATSNLTHPEQECHRVMDSYGLTLPVSTVDLPARCDALRIPTLRLRDWFAFVLRFNALHNLCGLYKPDRLRETAILSAFWERFEEENPKHEAFQMAREKNIDLSRTVPVICHGDEGCGQKHQAFLVINWHGVLGKGLRTSAIRKAGLLPKYSKLEMNFRGHSLTTRFVISCDAKALVYP